jgi:hypothetical protein
VRAKLSLVAVLLVVASAVTPAVAMAAPNGMVGIPDSNVTEDLPSGANVSISAADLEGSVMASGHASTTEIVLTTPSRATEYMNGSQIATSGDVALVIKDDTNHDGRRVAVPADAIKAAVGRVPEAVYGVHEDGTEWSAPVEAESGLLTFRVPKFSSNTVTFSAEVAITATPATDGSSYTYDVSDFDSVSDYTISVTGHTSSERESNTGNAVDPGATRSGFINLAGNAPPTNGTIEITGYGKGTTEWTNTSYHTQDKWDPIYVTVNPEVERVMSIGFSVQNHDTWDKYGENVYIDGEPVCGYDISESSSKSVTCTVDVPISDNKVNITSGDAGNEIYNVDLKGVDTDLTVTTNDGGSASFSDIANAGAKDIAVSRSTENLTFSHQYGHVDYNLTYTEWTKTKDPTIAVNGHITSYSGTLNDGETTPLETNESWVDTGENWVNVSVGDGSLSSDAPSPAVGLEYRHDAATEIQTEYVADGWTESYNVSHTFPSDQQDATLTVPFASTVYEIRTLEKRVNGGTWTNVDPANYVLNDTTLTVSLGNVNAGDEIAIRTTAYKVDAVNGQITVTDPTDPSDSGLDAEIRVDARSDGFHVATGNTSLGDRLTYTHSQSWDNPDEYALIDAGGDQSLYLPNAPTGATARVTTVPLEAAPESGDVAIHVSDPDGPTFAVSSGQSSSGDTVEFRYLAASSGTTYELYSVSRGRVMDKDTAESPAILLEDDSEETLRIRAADSSSTSEIGAPGSWEDVPSNPPIANPYAVLGTFGALVVLLTYATGKSDVISGRGRWVLLGAVTLGGGLLSFETLNPGSISSRIGAGVQEVVPLAGLAGVGIVVYSVVSWWRSRQKEAATPETKVSFDLGRSK